MLKVYLWKIGESGRMRYEFDGVTMETFASLLSRYVDRPVVNQTGLKGRYQGSFEVDLMALANKALGSITPDADPAGANAIPDPRDAIVSSLKQLGLKLDSRVLPWMCLSSIRSRERRRRIERGQ